MNQDELVTCRPEIIFVNFTTFAPCLVHRQYLIYIAPTCPRRRQCLAPGKQPRAYLPMLLFGVHGQRQCFSASHEASAASIMGHVDAFQLTPTDRMAMVSSISFSISVLETFAAWAAGVTICIASEEDILTDVGHILARLEATCVFTTPTLPSMIEGGPSTVPGCVDDLHVQNPQPRDSGS